MSVTTEEVAAAKAFLSELPLGIASTTGIAAVRTLMASHEFLESLLGAAEIAVGGEPSQASGNVIGALVARVAKLKEALDARSAEAILLRDRNSLTETRLQQALEEVRKREEATALLEEERARAGRYEVNLRRSEERLRETAGEMSNLARRVEELEQLFGAADLESQRQTKRADGAESAERAAREIAAEREAAIALLRTRIAEQVDAASENALGLERRITSLTSAIAAKDKEMAGLAAQLQGERERIEDLVRSREAQASYAEAQQQLVASLRSELDNRIGEVASLSERLDATRSELRLSKTRAAELQEALLPFAEMAESYNLADAGWVVDSGWCEDRKHRIVVADFRTARSAALEESPGSGSPLAPDLLDERDVRVADDAVREGTSP